MSDGLNDARAMRIAEVMTDYQGISGAIAAYQPYLAQTQQGTAGHTVLQQCITQATQLLVVPFTGAQMPDPVNDDDQTKLLLQRIMLDAATRRFRAMRIYQRTACAVRWITRRNQLLGGRPASSANPQALAQVDNQLRTEIIAVTDQRVFSELNQRDTAAGNWIGEMPSLPRIQQFITQQG